MTILLISEFFPSTAYGDFTGGVEVRTYYLAQFLAKKHTVHIIAARERGKPQQQVIKNVNVWRVGPIRQYSRYGNIVNRLAFIIDACRKGFTLKFDLVEGCGFLSYIPAYILGSLRGTKKIIFVADIVQNYLKDAAWIYFYPMVLLEKFLFSRSWDATICISKTVKKELIKDSHRPNSISTMYCGVDTKMINRIHVKKYKFPTICVIARLVPYKRVIDVITAVFALSRSSPKIHCKIIGTGEEKEFLRTCVTRLALRSRIIFYDNIPRHADALRILKRSHVFCLTSVVEGFGIATIEAMAAGLPVILTDLPVNREVTHGHGVFFRPRDPIDLSKKIGQLLKNKKKMTSLSIRGKAIANFYDWNSITKQTQTLYESLSCD